MLYAVANSRMSSSELKTSSLAGLSCATFGAAPPSTAMPHPAGATRVNVTVAPERAFAPDVEYTRNDGRVRSRLPATHGDPVAAGAHQVHAVRAHVAQVAVAQRELHVLCSPGFR